MASERDDKSGKTLLTSWNEWLTKFERAAASADPRHELSELLAEFSQASLQTRKVK